MTWWNKDNNTPDSKEQQQQPKQLLADGKRWQQLRPSIRWNPTEGDAISGIFFGLKERSGEFGDYKCAIVSCSDATYSVSGVRLIDSINCSTLRPGDEIRIVYRGREESNSGYIYKCFEVYTTAVTLARREIA